MPALIDPIGFAYAAGAALMAGYWLVATRHARIAKRRANQTARTN